MFLFLLSFFSNTRQSTLPVLLSQFYPSILEHRSVFRRREFDSIPVSEFFHRYRFTKIEVLEIKEHLQIPNEIRLENSGCIDGRIAFCILLDKLAHPTTNTKLEYYYRVDKTTISRIINYLLYFINDKFS